MATKSFTSSSVKIFKESPIFRNYNIFILGTKCCHIKVIRMMKNPDQSVEINHNLNLSYILDHLYKICIIGGPGYKMSLKLIKNQRPDIDKIYFKDPFKSKYQLLKNEREKVGIKELKISEAFIGYSQTTDDVYEDFEDYNRIKKRRVLIVFDDMIVDTDAKSY